MTERSGRIGVIYPSDGVLDFEFWRCVPPGVSVHVTRSLSPQITDGTLTESQRHTQMAESEDLDEAAATFALIGANSVAYACTAASFTRGVGYDTEIIRRIEVSSGAPATTTSTAAVAALQELGVTRVAVAAPYEDAGLRAAAEVHVRQRLRRSQPQEPWPAWHGHRRGPR